MYFSNSFYTYNIFNLFILMIAYVIRHYYRATFKHDYAGWVNNILISQEETKRSNYMRRLSFEILKMSYLNQSEFQI